MASQTRGSQYWLRAVVAQEPELINYQLRESLQLPDRRIEWCSPLAPGFKEYRDGAALAALGCPTPRRELRDFWPQRGPVWDGLARVGHEAYLLVEAKAHIPEAASPGSRATPASRERIMTALAEARRHWAPRSKAPWDEIFYQYANRLATLYFLRVVNGQPAHLAFVYFLNATDVEGPTTVREWKGAIRLLHAALGVSEKRLRPFVHEVFVDVLELAPVG
jgi:hypothetical protein